LIQKRKKNQIFGILSLHLCEEQSWSVSIKSGSKNYKKLFKKGISKK
jgi:hypothetical protein